MPPRKGDETAPLSEAEVTLLRHARARPASLVLLVYHRDGAEVVHLRPDTAVTVGREPPVDVAIDDSSLSRRHARFVLRDGEVSVEDLGSRNGTRLRGTRVDRGVVNIGDEVLLGGVAATVHSLDDADARLAGLESHDQFCAALGQEAARARYFGRSLTLFMMRLAGGSAAVLARHGPALQAGIRPVDRIGLYSPDTLEIQLPELGAEEALEQLRPLVEAIDVEVVCSAATLPEAAATPEELLDVCRAALRRARPGRPARAAPTGGVRGPAEGEALPETGVVAESPGMRSVLETVARVARANIPVLLLGETGVGKEVVARTIHEGGARRDRPLVCVNCGSIPAQLVEGILFGHEKGAFTGAAQQHRGMFEAAQGGTVLLDEIGELPLAAQAALLRVLETKRILRLGSTKEVEVDVRVLAATHRDLEAMCEAGRFRTDLLYRLDVMTVTIPPLRERRQDILPLAARFLADANRANDRRVAGLVPEAAELCETYAWPGNVRELRNAIERAVVIAREDRIEAIDLPERVRAAGDAISLVESADPLPRESQAADDASDAHGGLTFRESIRQQEVELILGALRETGGNQTAAAARLGMPIRSLIHKMKLLGIKKLGFGPALSTTKS